MFSRAFRSRGAGADKTVVSFIEKLVERIFSAPPTLLVYCQCTPAARPVVRRPTQLATLAARTFLRSSASPQQLAPPLLPALHRLRVVQPIHSTLMARSQPDVPKLRRCVAWCSKFAQACAPVRRVFAPRGCLFSPCLYLCALLACDARVRSRSRCVLSPHSLVSLQLLLLQLWCGFTPLVYDVARLYVANFMLVSRSFTAQAQSTKSRDEPPPPQRSSAASLLPPPAQPSLLQLGEVSLMPPPLATARQLNDVLDAVQGQFRVKAELTAVLVAQRDLARDVALIRNISSSHSSNSSVNARAI